LNKPFIIPTNNEECNKKLYNYLVDLSTYSVDSYLKDSLGEEVLEKIKESMRFIIQGIEIDLRLPIIFLCMNFICIDNYLYISLTPK
jgi:hypothetical protein